MTSPYRKTATISQALCALLICAATAAASGQSTDLTNVIDTGEGVEAGPELPTFSTYVDSPGPIEISSVFDTDTEAVPASSVGAAVFGVTTLRVSSSAPKGPPPVAIGGLLVLGALATLEGQEATTEIEFGAKEERERERQAAAVGFERGRMKREPAGRPTPQVLPLETWITWPYLLPASPAAPVKWQTPCATPPCVDAPVPVEPTGPRATPQTAAPKPKVKPALPQPIPAVASDKPPASPAPPAQSPPSPATPAPQPPEKASPPKGDPRSKVTNKAAPAVPTPTTREERAYYRARDAFRGHGNGRPLSSSELEAARERRRLECERLRREREEAARRGDRVRVSAITQELHEQRGFPRWLRLTAQRAREAEQRRPDSELSELGIRGLRREADRARRARSRATYRYTRTGNAEDLQAELAARQYANAVDQRLRARLSPTEPREVAARAAVEAAARGEQDLSQRFSFNVLRRARGLARRDYNTAYQAGREDDLARARQARRQLGAALREHRDYPLWQRLRRGPGSSDVLGGPQMQPPEELGSRELRTELRHARRQFDLWRRRAQRDPDNQTYARNVEEARDYRNRVRNRLALESADGRSRAARDRAQRLLAGDTTALEGLTLQELTRTRYYVRRDLARTQRRVKLSVPGAAEEYERKRKLQLQLTERIATTERDVELAAGSTAAQQAERAMRRLLAGDEGALDGLGLETLERVRDRVADRVDNARRSLARGTPSAQQRANSRHAALKRVSAAIEEMKRAARLVAEKDLATMGVDELESELTEAEKALNRNNARYYYNIRRGNTPDGREDMERARAYRDRVKAELAAARRDPARNVAAPPAPESWSELTPPIGALEPPQPE